MISHAGFDFARLCLVDGQLFRQLTEETVAVVNLVSNVLPAAVVVAVVIAVVVSRSRSRGKGRGSG
jgi:hypothetical protein